MTNGEWAVVEEDFWQMVFSQKCRSNGTSRVKGCQVPVVGGKRQTTLGLILRLRVVDRILEVDIRVDKCMSWRGRRPSGTTVLVGLGW